MDYTKDQLRLHKRGPAGMEVYNISVKNGMIVLDSGPMGGRTHRVMHPLSEKPRVDRLVASLLEQGYAPFEKTFGPWSQVRHADQQREMIHQIRQTKAEKLRQKWGEYR